MPCRFAASVGLPFVLAAPVVTDALDQPGGFQALDCRVDGLAAVASGKADCALSGATVAGLPSVQHHGGQYPGVDAAPCRGVGATAEQPDRVAYACASALLYDLQRSGPDMFGVAGAAGGVEHQAKLLCVSPSALDHGKVGLGGDVLRAISGLELKWSPGFVQGYEEVDFACDFGVFDLRLVWHCVSLTSESRGHVDSPDLARAALWRRSLFLYLRYDILVVTGLLEKGETMVEENFSRLPTSVDLLGKDGKGTDPTRALELASDRETLEKWIVARLVQEATRYGPSGVRALEVLRDMPTIDVQEDEEALDELAMEYACRLLEQKGYTVQAPEVGGAE